MENDFWKKKKLNEMSDEEWESLCDGCGKCCFRKFIDGHLWKKRLYFTRIACDCLDLGTMRCTCYEDRFVKQRECTHLNPGKVKEFKWLPETCAYRLVSEGKELPEWHPLVSGSRDSVMESGAVIKDGVHEKDAGDWEAYILDCQKA